MLASHTISDALPIETDGSLVRRILRALPPRYRVRKVIATDDEGNAYVAGTTFATEGTAFPTTPLAFRTTYQGGEADAFVTKLNPDGSGLVFSTYLGGDEFDLVAVGRALIADPEWPTKIKQGREDEIAHFTPEALQTL